MTEPRFAVGGIDSAGTVRPFLMRQITTGSYGLVTDTELTLAADNISISNVKTFIDNTGTVNYAAVDASTRILLSPSSTVQVSATSTISTSNTSTVNFPTTSTVNFPSSSTVQISTTSSIAFATTSTVNIPITSTVNIGGTAVLSATSTVPISFATTSTLGAAISVAANQTGTIPVTFAITSTVQPGGTQDVYTKARYYLGTQLFTSTVVAASGTINSGTIDISKYEIKTVSVYVTAGNNNSTLKIDVSPTASGTINEYYVNNIASTVFTTKSFTEAFSNIRVQMIASTVNSTVDAWLGLMA